LERHDGIVCGSKEVGFNAGYAEDGAGEGHESEGGKRGSLMFPRDIMK
jgi:hypothetical protein